MSNIKGIIIKYINEHSSHGKLPEDMNEDMDLLQSGILDSFGFLALILSIEEEFQIKIDFEKTPPDTLTNIKNLQGVIQKYYNKL